MMHESADRPMSAEPASVSRHPPAVRIRWWILTVVSSLGALAYVPALSAMGVAVGPAFVMALVVAAGIICGIAAWFGLRWADRAGLPMPFLKDLETRQRIRLLDPGSLLLAIAGGILLGFAAVGVLRGFGLENMPGSLAARLSSTLFAAVSLEVVIHLGIMSGVVARTRSRWCGILGAAAVFVLFHAGGVTGQPLPILATVVALNAASGLFFGWLYARFGLEHAFIAHAFAHAVACGVG
jgi:hypothetical protein